MQLYPNSLVKLALSLRKWLHSLINWTPNHDSLSIDTIVKGLAIKVNSLNWRQESSKEVISMLINRSFEDYGTFLSWFKENLTQCEANVLPELKIVTSFVSINCVFNLLENVRAINYQTLSYLPYQRERMSKNLCHLCEQAQVLLNRHTILKHHWHFMHYLSNLFKACFDTIKSHFFEIYHCFTDFWLDSLSIWDASVKWTLWYCLLKNTIENSFHKPSDVNTWNLCWLLGTNY
jgi:hypothetical protein